jgi:hypothetical protein
MTASPARASLAARILFFFVRNRTCPDAGTAGYERMADAIAKIPRPIIFSLCEWGWSQVWIWGKRFGQSWRTTGDIDTHWASLAAIIDFNSFHTQATDFYGRNDMDMVCLQRTPFLVQDAN